MNDSEEWRDIPGYEGRYMVSSHGHVMSLSYRNIKGLSRLLKLFSDSQGYQFVELSRKTHLVHRLVMSSFVGKSDMEVNHKDGDRTNNHIGNLEYCTHHANMHHANDVLGKRMWDGDFCRKKSDDVPWKNKLSPNNVREIRKLLADGKSAREIADLFSVSNSTVYSISSGKMWSHVQD